MGWDLQSTFGDDCSELFINVGPWARRWGCRTQLDTGFDNVYRGVYCKDRMRAEDGTDYGQRGEKGVPRG